MKRTIFRIFAFFLIFPFLAADVGAQTQNASEAVSGASVAVYKLDNQGIDASTAIVVSDLLFSFMREQRDYRIDFLGKTMEEALTSGTAAQEAAVHDLVFSGRLSAQPDGIRLDLRLAGESPETGRFISRTYENQNKLMLGTRLLVRELFDAQGGTAQAPAEETAVSGASQEPAAGISAAQPSAGTEPDSAAADAGAQEDTAYADIVLTDILSLDSLAGSWNGEAGIEKIMILRGGRGAAVFSSGFSLMISLSIQDGELVVSQRGKSSPLQFLDLPDPVAAKAAEQAPPLEWKFRISEDGKILAGEKNSVQITHDGESILSMQEKTEKVSWTRN